MDWRDQGSVRQTRNFLLMRIPKYPKSLKEVPHFCREVIDCLRMLQITSVNGGTFSQSTSGTAINITNKPKDKALESFPTLYLIPAGTDSSGDLIALVTAGYVNGEMPTLGGTALDNSPPPTITIDADKYVWLKCVGTFGTPDTYVVTVVTETTDVIPTGTAITSTGFTSFFKVGFADFTAGDPDTLEITNNHSGGNLGVDSWGLYNLWWRS